MLWWKRKDGMSGTCKLHAFSNLMGDIPFETPDGRDVGRRCGSLNARIQSLTDFGYSVITMQ